MTFEMATRVTEMIWDVPEGWRQGRGAFGGLTLATLARVASQHADAAGRTLRTLTAEIPSAVLAGPAKVELEMLRAGSGLTTIAAKLAQNGETVAHAVCSFGKTRVTDFDRNDVPAPSPTPFANVPAIPADSPGPEFARHVEYRLIRGVPFASEKDAVTEGWIRIREPGDVPREIALIALIDAWFPSVMPVTSAPRPFGTISFAAHLFEREWSLEEPLYHRSRLIASQQGYFVEVRELFTPRGEICAINQQTMAVIK
jgi:acyl-CoA thioesterase